MKKNVTLTLMLAVGAASVLGSVALAQQSTVDAQLTYKNIVVYADGKLVDTTGAEPFIYNGTTYLPVRAVADAIGKEVNWVGETNTVYLGAMPSNFVETDTKLEDMYSYNSTFSKIEHIQKGADNLSNKYTSGAVFYCTNAKTQDENSVEYSLNGKYKSIKGTVCVPYVDRKNTNEKVVKIYGDDKLLFTSKTLTAGSQPENIDLDLKGVAVLKIEIDGSGAVGFFDAIVYAGN